MQFEADARALVEELRERIEGLETDKARLRGENESGVANAARIVELAARDRSDFGRREEEFLALLREAGAEGRAERARREEEEKEQVRRRRRVTWV